MGQKVLVFGGNLSSFIFEGANIDNNNVLKSNPGGLALNLDGEALGIALSGDTINFASIETITGALQPTNATTP